MKRAFIAVAVALIAAPVATGQAPGWSGRGPWKSKTDVKVRIPFRIFDNIYYVGTDHVSSYLVTTTAGLVLIDATSASAIEGVLENVRKLGFEPKNIKYVFVTQAHQDHYGGTLRIKEVTGARIGMSLPDLEFLEQKKLRANDPVYQWSVDPAPARDLIIEDNKVIEVGKSAFKFYLTPGHTPGSLSMEYIAQDGDRQYRILTPGGLGFSYGPEWNDAYIASMERLRESGPWDVVLSNHPFMVPGHLFVLMKNAEGMKPGTHPLVLGPRAVNEWFDAILTIAREKADSERSARQR